MKPDKPSTPANTKALQAWQSELRKLEKRLEEWANVLAERERVLEEQEAAFEDALDGADDKTVQRYSSTWEDAHGEDCGCGDTDAGAGCDCPKCQNIRADWVGGEGFSEGLFVRRSARIPDHLVKGEPVGDEIKWLESLWKLEDKRKKKK